MVGAVLGEAMGHSLRRQLPLLCSLAELPLGLCFLHLPPEAFEANSRAGLWVIGDSVQIGLEHWSKGMEHAVVHGNRFGTLAFLSLCLHAFIEAMPFGLEDLGQHVHDHHHHHSGESGWGAAVRHWPPQAAGRHRLDDHPQCHRDVPGAPLDVGHRVFAVVPFLGILLAGTLPQDAATFGALNGLLVGILLHIATTILFETADGHEFNGRKFLTVLLGLALSLMTTHQ